MVAVLNINRLTAEEIRRALERAASWWVAELLALAPDRLAHLWTARGEYRLLVLPGGATTDLQLWRDGRLVVSRPAAPADAAAGVLDGFLAGMALSRSRVPIWLRLPPDRFFARSFDIPAEFRGEAARLGAIEIERKTPFGLDDIFCDLYLEPLAGGAKLRVHQWIIKRAYVEEAIADGGFDLADFAGVAAAVAASETPGSPAISLRSGKRMARSSTRAVAFLALCAASLALLCFATTVWRQQGELERLDGEIAATRKTALDVRARAQLISRQQDSLTQLYEYRQTFPPFVAIWEEVSRILPQDSWLTDLRMTEAKPNERSVSMEGFSAASAGLVGILDQSTLFAQTSLTAPIAPDPIERRERFALQARLKQASTAPVSR